MAFSVVNIYNLALSACGSRQTIASVDERSAEAHLCNQWYELVRDNLLSAAPWPSVRTYKRLALLREQNGGLWSNLDPAPGYCRLYSPPSDMIHPYYLQNYARFEYSLVGETRGISTNADAPILYYNSRQVNPDLWEQGLRMAIIHTLATYLAIPQTGRSSRLQENMQISMMHVEAAHITAANNGMTEEDALPDWLAARGNSYTGSTRFTYPFNYVNYASVA